MQIDTNSTNANISQERRPQREEPPFLSSNMIIFRLNCSLYTNILEWFNCAAVFVSSIVII